MKRKKQVLEFLNSNYGMINSLMCSDEREMFNGDVVKILLDDINKKIKDCEEH